MILFDGVALRYALQLRQSSYGGAVIHCFRDLLLIADQPELFQLRIPRIPQRTEVCARFLERREIAFQVRFGAAF